MLNYSCHVAAIKIWAHFDLYYICNGQLKFHPPFFLFLGWRPSWLEVWINGHNFGRGPYKYHSTKVWLQLAQWFLRRRLKFTTYDGRQEMAKAHMAFGHWPIRNKNYLWRPCLLMDRDEMSNLYREPSIDASYQVSVQLGVSEEKIKMWNINGRRTPKAHIAFGKVC